MIQVLLYIMAASKVSLTFDQFWMLISKSVASFNHPTYHPCCRVWVSRAKKDCRDSHKEKLSWGVAMNSVGGIHTDSRAVLKAHMLENGWGEPVKFNIKCSSAISQEAVTKSIVNCLNPTVAQSNREKLNNSGSQHSSTTSPLASPFQLQDSLPQPRSQFTARADVSDTDVGSQPMGTHIK